MLMKQNVNNDVTKDSPIYPPPPPSLPGLLLLRSTGDKRRSQALLGIFSRHFEKYTENPGYEVARRVDFEFTELSKAVSAYSQRVFYKTNRIADRFE